MPEKTFMDVVWTAMANTVTAIAVIAFCALISAFPIKWCWNYTMPYLFHLPEIGAWHAFCLTWLTGAFFKASPAQAANKKD